MDASARKRTRKAQRRISLAADYRPFDGVPDEMVDAGGALRPVWKPLIDALDALGSEELTRRFARADQYLRDAGVYYRVYDKAGAAERAWPLAHVPLLIDEREWQAITAGLVQRAELFEAIVADIYGREPPGRRRAAAARPDRRPARNFCGRWSA